MTRFGVVVTFVLATAAMARAQDMNGSVNFGGGMPGMNFQMNVNDPNAQQGNVQVAATAGRHEEKSVDKPGESWKITWDTEPSGKTQFKVLAPEGLGVRISDNGAILGQDTVPTSLEVPAGHFLRVELFTPQAVLFDKKFEAKAGMVAQLRARVFDGGPAVAMNVQVNAQPVQPAMQPVQPMQAAPAPVASACMGDDDMSSIKSAVEGESFSKEKLSVLESALGDRRLCVAQVIDVLGLFDFGNDKLSALKMMAPKINDRSNNFKVFSAFTFDSEKAEAKKILK